MLIKTAKSQKFLLNNGTNTAYDNKNYNYIKFLYKLCNLLLNNLIVTQPESEIKEKDETEKKPVEIFTPQAEFFNLYNNLNQLISTMVKENIMTKNEIDSESGSFVNKVYYLLIKELIEDQNEDESNSISVFLLIITGILQTSPIFIFIVGFNILIK